MHKKIIVLLLITTLISCKKKGSDDSDQNEKDKIKMAHWLIGKWENKSEEGTLSETWKKSNDSTYEGQSYYIRGKDTVHFETIRLQQTAEELSYSAMVKGQNNDKTIHFALTNSTEKQLIFENPKHNYPKKISYTQLSKDNLVTEISGIQQGKPSSEKYAMIKTK